jgi:hypothetical protein
MVAVRPRPVAARALALTLAVGLCGMLIGLSIAATQMPGDTFQATPKAIASAFVVSPLDDGGADPGPSYDVVLFAFLAVTLALSRSDLVLVRARQRHRRWVTPALPVAGGRGPPPAIR